MELLYLNLVKLQWTLMGGVRPVYRRQACQNTGGFGGIREVGGNKWVVSRRCCRSFMKYLHWSAVRQPQFRKHYKLFSKLRKYLERLRESYHRNKRFILSVHWSSPFILSSNERAHLHLGFSWKKRNAKSCPCACYEVTWGNGCTSPRILNFGTRLK